MNDNLCFTSVYCCFYSIIKTELFISYAYLLNSFNYYRSIYRIISYLA